jgi:hypothetical protein
MAFKVPRYASLPYLLAVPAGGLFLAYLYAWLHRPDFPEQYALEDRKSHLQEIYSPAASTYEYPAWYNSTPSPYDAQPVELAEDVDILVWIGE